MTRFSQRFRLTGGSEANSVNKWFGGGFAAEITAYESIQTYTVGSGGSATITLSSIPATYSHLQIRVMLRGTAGVAYSSAQLTFNGDTASNYSFHFLAGDGSTAYATANASQTQITSLYCQAASATSGMFGVGIIDILDYTNVNKYKTIRSLTGHDSNGSGNLMLIGGNWRSLSAINSITIVLGSGSLAEYSSFALYGIKVAV